MNSCRSIEFCRVHAAVDHVQHRHRQRPRRVAAELAVQRDARLGGSRLRRGERDRRGSRSRRAGPCSACRRARSAPRRAPPGRPASSPRTASRELAVHVATAVRDALAAPLGAAVTQLDRLVHAGRRAGRHDRPAERARLEPHIDLDRRVAPRVEHLPSAHVGIPLIRARPLCLVEVPVLLGEREPRPILARRPRRGAPPASTRARKRLAAARSSSSGSTFSRRATLTPANSTSPSSAAAARDPARASAAGIRRGSSARSSRSSSSRSASAPATFRVVEADRCSAPLHLARVAAAPAALRDVVEDALARLLLDLDPLPVLRAPRRAVGLDRRRTRAGGAGQLRVHVPRDRLEVAVPRSSRAAARGSTTGRAGRRARRAASRRRRRAPRRRPRRPPRPCAARSSASVCSRSQGHRAAAARSAPGARPALRREPRDRGLGRRRVRWSSARTGRATARSRSGTDLPARAVALRQAVLTQSVIACCFLSCCSELLANRAATVFFGRRLRRLDRRRAARS